MYFITLLCTINEETNICISIISYLPIHRRAAELQYKSVKCKYIQIITAFKIINISKIIACFEYFVLYFKQRVFLWKFFFFSLLNQIYKLWINKKYIYINSNNYKFELYSKSAN